jgi:hypothetical protein
LKIVLNGNFIFPTVSLHNNILMKIECQFDCLWTKSINFRRIATEMKRRNKILSNRTDKGQRCRQLDDSVPLYKYCHVYKLSTQSISKEMNTDELKFSWQNQIVGLADKVSI